MLPSKLYLIILLTLFYLGVNGETEVDKVKKYLTYKIDQMKQHFERSLNQMKDEMKDIKGKSANHTCNEGWTPYEDEKCYKIVERKGTEADAKAQCLKLDDSSTLATIQSENEMNFLSNLLIKYNEISAHAWIGLEFNAEDDPNEAVQEMKQNIVVAEGEENEPELQQKQMKAYKWIDDSPVNYQHWDEDADRRKDCVKMSLTRSSLGRWTDDSCTKKFLIVCQIKQWTPTVMGQELQFMTKLVKKQNKDLKDQRVVISQQQTELGQLRVKLEEKPKEPNYGIPIGFIYTQLPRQSDPNTLWPNTSWTEVTEDYAGLFFRAEGGNSEPFGETQSANQSHISDIYFKGGFFNFFSGTYYPKTYSTTLVPKKWKDINHEESLLLIHTLKFFKTTGEVRPENTAVKIWKRVK